MILSKRIRQFYRNNYEEYRWLLIGNVVAFFAVLFAFITPFWIVRVQDNGIKESYGSFWVS